MEVIEQLFRDILAPLSSDIILAAITAGLFFGAFYNYRLRVPISFVYHKLVAGLGFITFIFLFRLVAGETVNPAGWIGIGLLWVIFCGFIWIGETIRTNRESIRRR